MRFSSGAFQRQGAKWQICSLPWPLKGASASQSSPSSLTYLVYVANILYKFLLLVLDTSSFFFFLDICLPSTFGFLFIYDSQNEIINKTDK